MSTLFAPMASLMIGGARRYARCWKLTRPDTTVFTFTDHGSLLVVDGLNYSPLGAVDGSAEAHEEGTKFSNRDFGSALRSDKIREVDLRAGKYRGATIDEFTVDWQFPFGGKYYERLYTIENTVWDGEKWKATIASMRERLEVQIGHTMHKTCNVRRFGDTRCGVNKAAFAITGRKVTAISTQRIAFVCDVANTYALDFFADGDIVWTVGNNTGLQLDVKGWDPTTQLLELYAPTPYLIAINDEFTITQGCDRRFETCDGTYGNALRFRGYPGIPGSDALFITPDATE